MTSAELVHRADKDGVAVLTLDSPHNRNALSRDLVAQLSAHLNDISDADEMCAVLIRSSTRVFCSGADLAEARTADMVEHARGLIALQRTLAEVPVPVVVRLDGPVRAGGLGLVASADIVVCRASVTFALTEVRLGLVPAVISIPLLERLPSRVAADWFLTGRTITAVEAATAGLVTTVCADEDTATDAAIESVLTDLRAGQRQGLVEAKVLLNARLLAAYDDRGEAMAQLSGRLFQSPLAQAAMAAFRRG